MKSQSFVVVKTEEGTKAVQCAAVVTAAECFFFV